MKCKNCKYWGKNRSSIPDAEVRLKSCSCPAMHYGYHLKDEDVKDDGVRVEEDEGWGMATGPDFGCVHFEQFNPQVYHETHEAACVDALASLVANSPAFQAATATRNADEAGQRIASSSAAPSAAALANLLSLSEAERIDVFSNFCLRCGSDNPRCQCWNDE